MRTGINAQKVQDELSKLNLYAIRTKPLCYKGGRLGEVGNGWHGEREREREREIEMQREREREREMQRERESDALACHH
jgi:hypothetical protein